MIVANGDIAMDIDLSRLHGLGSQGGESKLDTLRFHISPNSFFTVLIFNDTLRGPDAGSMGLIPENTATLPGPLQASLSQLVIEKLPPDAPFDLAVRDGKTGFVFFNIEGNLYGYDATARSLSIGEGRLLISEEFANDALGDPRMPGWSRARFRSRRPMYPIETTTLVNGAVQSSILPPRRNGVAGRSEFRAWTRCHCRGSLLPPNNLAVTPPRWASLSERFPAITELSH